MATGGIFQLITNDGKQDRMLMASALLKQSIDAARARRVAAGNPDCTPTLYDIERTHILFTNAHFKPFAAIGYEYNKVTPSAGASTLGSSVTFSIPQFGDFFNDMVVHAVITQPTLSSGTSTNPADQNLMRWCAYPGERLLKNVKFEVNGNPLDEYTRDAVNFHREFSVQPNKQTGWNRCMGQEEVEIGQLDQPDWVNSGVSAANIQSRTVVSSKSGHQTPTGQKTALVELFIPLLFWCNKDPRLSIPSVAIPYGQRFINIELATQDELVNIVPRGANYGNFADTSVASGGGFSQGSVLQKIELYINNIFVNPEVHNIFIKRIGFTLIRVHRKQVATADGGEESILLQQLKWPIEALFVGVRMQDYNSSDSVHNRRNLDKWHRFSRVDDVQRVTQGWQSQRASVLRSGTTIRSVVPSLLATDNFRFFADGVNNVTAVATRYLSTDLLSGDVLNVTVGSVPYTLPVLSIQNDTNLSYLPVTGVPSATLAGALPSLGVGTFTIGAYSSGGNITATSSVAVAADLTVDDKLFFVSSTNIPVTLTVQSQVGGLTYVFKETWGAVAPAWAGDAIHALGAEAAVSALTTKVSTTASDIVFGVTGLAALNNVEIVSGTPTTVASVIRKTSTEATSRVAVCTPTVDWITIKAHGIPIYNKFPAKFYNAYIPLNYGGPNIRTPEDCGAMLITFCLYPGTYQPSGHINVSRAREFYIDFNTTSAINNTVNADRSTNMGSLIVIASAINFLLISDGSAVLRYST